MISRRTLLRLFPALANSQTEHAASGLFLQAIHPDNAVARKALDAVGANWRDSYAIMLLELVRLFAQVRRNEPADVPSPARAIQGRIFDFLVSKTRKRLGEDARAWTRWAWSLPYDPHPDYAQFKGFIYSKIDPRMAAFFPEGVQTNIRLDQVEWGGVKVNGIPPLVNPPTVSASEAKYLKDSNVVFGIEIAGEARAYPKRILAWHEMARDRVGGIDLAVVYCTLCGTVIPYRTQANGRRFTLGTSGLLYESSKLMFDEETKSLWSTLQGQPVIGPLSGKELRLTLEPVVTTTWGEWRSAHPATSVLSPETGHQRDYSEGAAYRDYFATDELMFEVSRSDRRLRNKDEVLVIRLPGKSPLAVAVRLLQRKPEYKVEHEGVSLTIQTTRAGANRVFIDGKRVPAHRAFWFGWYSQNPQARLIQ